MTMRSPIAFTLFLAFCAPSWADDIELARNEWTAVMKSDFDAEVARFPKDQQFAFLSSAERVARMVENILFNKTMAAQARAAKIDKDPAVQADIHSMIEKTLARHQVERIESELKAPDLTKRAEELYKIDPKKYSEQDIVHVRHILVDSKCRTPEAAKARAMEARGEILKGTPFPEVAQKYSDDPSAAKNGGDIGPMVLTNLSPAFAEAARAMKPGDISAEPVLTNFGYHILKLESVTRGRQYTFDEVKAGILAELNDGWLKQQRQANYDKVTADPKLKLNLDAIQALKTNVGAPAPQPKRPG
jgi:peptidyl-prolyl cis-trans isomerase C